MSPCSALPLGKVRPSSVVALGTPGTALLCGSVPSGSSRGGLGGHRKLGTAGTAGHGLGWQVPPALPCASREAAAAGGTCTAPAPGPAASKDPCGILGEGRASLGFTAQPSPAAMSPSCPFASARSCSVAAEVAGAQLTWPVPLEVGSTKLLKRTELVPESRAAQTPSNPPPHSRRCPQLAICQQRGDFFLMPA